MAAIVEYSNNNHPGMIYMQSTGDGENLIPITIFIDVVNGSFDLIKFKKPFINQIITGMDTFQDYDKLADLCNQYIGEENAQKFLENRGKKKGVWFLDYKYFQKKYTGIINAENQEDKKRFTKELFKEFIKTLEETLDLNKKGTILKQKNNLNLLDFSIFIW